MTTHFKPIFTPIKLVEMRDAGHYDYANPHSIRPSIDYTRTLVEMRDAGHYDYANPNFNDSNFPVEAGENGERELVLVGFNRVMSDNEDPAKSELLYELGRLGLRPEGAVELCAVGEQFPDLQRQFPIVARRQVWQFQGFRFFCPILIEDGHGRSIQLYSVRGEWDGGFRFLASLESN